MELVPIHPIHGVQDWDAAPGAISWQRLIDTFQVIRQTGKLPPDHRSHDHLNEQKEIAVDPQVSEGWMLKFTALLENLRKRTGKEILALIKELHEIHVEVYSKLRMCTIQAFLR